MKRNSDVSDLFKVRLGKCCFKERLRLQTKKIKFSTV